ncbi:MAG: hypothetical protein IT580_20530, partial [Verrucomicrobiales bacterium]|nr:hypothetical protein [Verrucomicrobiales bacterium]
RPEGRILSYRESVGHHVVGALANLESTARHAPEMLADLRAARVLAHDPQGPYAHRTFALLPTANHSRLREWVELLHLHGLEVHRSTRDLVIPAATDGLGRDLKDVLLPAGTILVPNRQPLGHLAAAILEFDPRLSPAVLEDERREILRTGGSRMYDATSWSLCHLTGLPALTLHTDLPEATEPLLRPTPAPGLVRGADHPVAWIFDGADDLATAAAARLLERGVQVRAANKPFTFDGHPFERGSAVVVALDNRTFPGDLATTVAHTAAELGLDALAVASGLGAGDLPDLGGSHFVRLEPPRIGIAGRDTANSTDFGSLWHAIDHQLGIRNSPLERLNAGDLHRYNVLILPDGTADEVASDALANWIRQGGTLIAVGSATRPFLSESNQLSHVRDLPDALGKLPEYELAILREWEARHIPPLDTNAIWSHQPSFPVAYPWPGSDGAHPEEKELKRRDTWQRPFMPAGTILATRIDTNHWLTAGTLEPLPVMADRGPVLMVAEGAQAPIRFGLLTPTPTNSSAVVPPSSQPANAASEAEKKKEFLRPGWAMLPTNTVMHLRMGGLLWPEASQRLAHAAWVTCESVGRGQIILFASPPTFRGGAKGTQRILLNAVVLGPGMGATHTLRP